MTGDPGSGKSTAVSRIILNVKTEGFTVGGLLTREVRSHGEREGFRLIDVSTEETATLATVKKIPGPRIGKYHVDLKALGTFGANALYNARKADFIVCDEVGPMELLSPDFRRAVTECFIESQRPSLCVIHRRLADPVIEQLRQAPRSKLYDLDYENRTSLTEEISQDIILRLKSRQ